MLGEVNAGTDKLMKQSCCPNQDVSKFSSIHYNLINWPATYRTIKKTLTLLTLSSL